MKPKLSTSVCVVIALALVSFGLFYGTTAGFSDERKQATELLYGENGVMDMLSFRAADGLNLTVVARRHLPENDPDVAAMEKAARSLRSEKADLPLRKQENARLDAAVALVAQKLEATPGFAANERDKNYLSMLTADMQDLSRSTVIETYNIAAGDFNEKLNQPFIGTIATLLGIKPCELF